MRVATRLCPSLLGMGFFIAKIYLVFAYRVANKLNSAISNLGEIDSAQVKCKK
jgi:hypothetical protein